MRKKTYGRQLLTLNRIDDIDLSFVISKYIADTVTISFTDFHDNEKLHIYPWHQIKHVTIADTDNDTVVDI